MHVRIATFNAENLMARFDFSAALKDPRRRTLERADLLTHEDDTRQMTALAIADCRADIVCLQEIEDIEALEEFEQNYLNRMTGIDYPHKIWHRGNDGRGIDVALVARERTAEGQPIEILNSATHRKKTYGELGLHNKQLGMLGIDPADRVFRRDLLEVDLRIGKRMLTLFVCHFKSMGSGRDVDNGRDKTMPIRHAESLAVKQIINRKFGPGQAPKMRWMVCGDFNDYTERLVVSGDRHDGYDFTLRAEDSSGIDPLMDESFGTDLVRRRPSDDRWTLYHAAGPVENLNRPEERPVRHLVQLDYLLTSPALANGNPDIVPDIYRQGLPFRTPFPPGQDARRYPRTGWSRPKASDHGAVAVTLKMV